MDASSDSVEELKRDLFDVMHRLHQSRPMPLMTFEGVTRTEARAVHMIYSEGKYHNEGCVRPGCVAEHLHTTPSALSQVLKTLEDKGLVERVRAKGGTGDSRAVSLVLTPAGLILARDVDARFMDQTRALVAYVGEKNFRAAMHAAELVIEFYDKVLAGEIYIPGVDEPVVAPCAAGSTQVSSRADRRARAVPLPSTEGIAACAAGRGGERPCA